MTPAGIEPATFRFVAQHLNHCATAVPYYMWYKSVFGVVMLTEMMSQLSFIKSIYKLVSRTNKRYLAKLYVKRVICFTNALLQLLILLECNPEILTQRVQSWGQKKCSLFRDKPLRL